MMFSKTFKIFFTADFEVDKFYISQGIKLSWTDAFLYCKSHGLKLVSLASDDYAYEDIVSNLQKIVELKNEKILFDSEFDSFYVNTRKHCAVIDIEKTKNGEKQSIIPCTEDAYKFICEIDTEVQEKKLNATSIATDKLKFIKQLSKFLKYYFKIF